MHILDLYKNCNYGYFVIYDINYNMDYNIFLKHNWSGLIIDNNVEEKLSWISFVNYKTGLKNLFVEYNAPCMIHYLKLGVLGSEDILIDFFTTEYDEYYKIYEHGFLKKIPFIDIKYSDKLNNFLLKYHYTYDMTKDLFVHDRYKVL